MSSSRERGPDRPAVQIRQLLDRRCRPCEATDRIPPHTYRLVVLGDSYAFGFGVTREQALPAQLARVLRGRNAAGHVEVLNLGIPGMNLTKDWAFSRQLHDLVEYDMLLLVLSGDDAHPETLGELEARDAGVGPADGGEAWLTQWDPARAELGMSLLLLADLVRQERKAGREIVVAFYEPVPSFGSQPLAVLHGVCKGLSVPFVDLVSPYATFAARAVTVSPVDSHPNEMAHRLAAVELAAVIEPLLPGANGSVDRRQAMRERLEWLAGVVTDAALCLAAREALETMPEPPPDVVGGTAALGQAIDRHLACHVSAERLGDAASQLGDVTARLHAIERALQLPRLGLDLPHAVDASPFVQELRASLDSLVEALEQSGDAAAKLEESPAPTEGWLADRCQGLWAAIAAERDRASRHRAGVVTVARLMQAALSRLPSDAVASPDATTLCRGLARAVRQLAACVGTGAAPHGPVHVELEIAYLAGDEPGPGCLFATFAERYPRRVSYRQPHYLIGDGCAHRYVVDVPAGTAGWLTVELETAGGRPSRAESMEAWLVAGTTRRRYEPGDLFVSPLGAGRPATPSGRLDSGVA